MGSFVVLCLFLVVGSQLPTSTATPRCSEVEGSFRVPESGNQCIKIFGTHSGNWDSANKKCQDAGLQLAKPINPIALRKFILEKLGDGRYYWIGARGTSSGVEWLDGSSLSSSNPAWYPGLGRFMTNPDYCMKLLTYEVDLQQHPTKPYYIQPCEWTPNLFAMCEVPVPECPSPWILIGHQCFRVVGRNSAEWRNWASARTYCGDGDLAQPRDIKALADYIINANYRGISWFWLGGSDLGREGDWTWPNGSTIATGWRQGQPDNADGADCLAMNPNGGANSLYDHDCGRGEAFVCERY